MKFPEVGTYVGIALPDFIGTYIVEDIDEEMGKVRISAPDGGSEWFDANLIHVVTRGITPKEQSNPRSSS